MHCPKHLKYKGTYEVKRDCTTCKKVRQTYLIGVKKRKNHGKGGQFSITSPGFRCSIAHLLSEIGSVILFGPQPAFFWRPQVKSDPRAKAHFNKTYKHLQFIFGRDHDLYKQVQGLLWNVWEKDFNDIKRKEEHQVSVELEAQKQKPQEQSEPTSFLKHVKINPLLYGDQLDGQT